MIFFLRIFKIHKIKFKILNDQIVRMRTGGTSDQNLKSYVITTKEIINSIKNNGFKINYFRIILRAFVKIKELYFFDQKKLNKNFQLFKFNFQNHIMKKKHLKF